MTRVATLPVAGLLILLATGCAGMQYERSVLPTGLAGPMPAIHEEHRTEITPQRVWLTREYLRLHNPAALAALPPGDGAEAIRFTPRMIVVHYTAIPTLEETLETFAGPHIDQDRELVRRNGLLNVGIQFVVDRDGTLYALYPETAIARHVIGLNHVAIGIENVGDGELGASGAAAPLTEAQLAANVALVRYLAGRYPTIRYVIGHHEYRRVERPGHPAHALFHEANPTYRTEKSDPGPRFMKRLHRALRAAAQEARS
ncbi:MAG: N-acetylmuramoyl-L-alanine amidase [Thermoanaerobaculia bacterium]